MLSRVADLTYWTARYLERAENTARIVDVNAQLVLDSQSRQPDDPRLWEPLVYVSGGEHVYHKLYHGQVSEQSVLDFMLFDRRNPSSVVSCICYARENARCIRDQLSGEIWEEMNSFYLKLKDDNFERYNQVGSSEYLAWIKSQTQLFYGVAESMFPRTPMWRFYELGRFLERTDNTSRILDVKYFMLLPEITAVGSALDMVQWASVLRSCSGFEAFRKSRRGQLSLERVLDYLVLDPHFPRSIAFSIRHARHALAHITEGIEHLQNNSADDLLAEMEADLRATVINDVVLRGLHEYLDGIQLRVSKIHAAVQETFIHYSTADAKVLA